ncbi:MAG: hypothetical protein Q8R55_07295 [Candidatus Taylorbacteria bacterium]|nr:hypothetical protein [Candidatus Taylorbacteria bacterium]
MSRYEEYKKKSDAIKSAVSLLGHIPEYGSGGGHSDGYICSCGWKSNQYWDLAEAAWDEWLEHAKEIIDSGQARLNLK